jgi:hypothetical protein
VAEIALCPSSSPRRGSSLAPPARASDGSLLLYILFAMFIGPIAVNRSDLVITMRKGKWWWKSQNEDQHQET